MSLLICRCYITTAAVVSAKLGEVISHVCQVYGITSHMAAVAHLEYCIYLSAEST